MVAGINSCVMETKRFYKTSEFWVVVLTQVLAAGMEISGALPPAYGLPVHAFLSGFYAIARGQAKSGVTPVTKVEVK